MKGSNLRTVTYNGLTYENAERLKKLRPLPSYYGVFASSENMEEIFEKVFLKEFFKGILNDLQYF